MSKINKQTNLNEESDDDLDEEYKRYKPPPWEIDPSKHTVIEIGTPGITSGVLVSTPESESSGSQMLPKHDKRKRKKWTKVFEMNVMSTGSNYVLATHSRDITNVDRIHGNDPKSTRKGFKPMLKQKNGERQYRKKVQSEHGEEKLTNARKVKNEDKKFVGVHNGNAAIIAGKDEGEVEDDANNPWICVERKGRKRKNMPVV